ncbi:MULTISPECIES: 6,7-dimethyl-8-ribityllumazine synthase [Gimesia]|jgi:6,7-dimethyl-8-ribityllumazine synthase|uniref:6,7-dimethyl-8-ribityllumazine synthase n=1 Tax=Gimesia maris TaxID=122 RepID=A0A3D3R497_9PLAN|nr:MULTISPECIES: 6,7-dimethyl-8-ribityllumazine synthase [Gimesia]MAX37694.1 6,7-dimethyl-8-ribityllumazine synthase [Gimesia sp.]QDT80414.1 6,7-dimethyl-8-ribityllumazine synthase [Gimesia maris]HBL47437.1 6,7-dimethyl-8-ribityllumazine synthase [Planctomycetaceae bacterium]HCO22410.1 6,7-dimethyl-8-ribityllumazine synthase [Gimesia maris]|tara:strand:- start:146449 stop:146931 length:483 start_codon:yes stop_codon:yes gene_type:complete
MKHTLIEGDLLVRDASFAIVVSRWNELITRRLLEGALETFRRHGGSEENITVLWVPGSFELPLVADRLAKSGKYQAVCCLGAVIQGSTMHHDYINHQVAAGIMRSSQESGVPVLFGVLTCETMEQAMDRAGGKVGNKGGEAALAAIEMVNLLQSIDQNQA